MRPGHLFAATSLAALLVAACPDGAPADGDGDGGATDCGECWPEGMDQCRYSREIYECRRGADGCLHWVQTNFCMGPGYHCTFRDGHYDCGYDSAPPGGGDGFYCPPLRPACHDGVLGDCSALDMEANTTFLPRLDCTALGLECRVDLASPICGAPCDPLDGSGCAEGERCAGSFDEAGNEIIDCLPFDPTTADQPGAPCETHLDEEGRTVDDCTPGYACRTPVDGDTALCLAACTFAPDDCAAVFPDHSGNLTLPGSCVGTATDWAARCEPIPE